MTRIIAPDRGCIETETAPGRVHRGRIFEVSDPAEAKALKQAGYIIGGVGGVVKAAGYVCPKGHHNFFRTCGRCGNDN